MINSVLDHSLFSRKYQVRIREMVKFEIKSLVGRFLMNKLPYTIPNSLGLNLLNLGCSDNYFDGWVNADFFQFNIKFWKSKKRKPDWMLDLRYHLNCPDNYWDGIFCEHTLEHLTPSSSLKLMKELFKKLKPACFLRITVPDLKKYIDFYCKKPVHQNFLKWSMGAEAIQSVAQNWGHLSVWDSELLSIFLQEAGFINIVETGYMEGSDRRIIKDSENRRWETLYMEAQKPQLLTSHNLQKKRLI